MLCSFGQNEEWDISIDYIRDNVYIYQIVVHKINITHYLFFPFLIGKLIILAL